MKKRQLKKLAKNGLNQFLKMDENIIPIRPAKVQHALWLYLHKNHNVFPSPEIYSSFYERLDRNYKKGLWFI